MGVEHPLLRGPERWMSAWGHDRVGPWCAFEVGAFPDRVEQRMRWVPPGSFQMGSPGGEWRRYSDEGPRDVTLTRGFWIAETPCSQALWETVIREDPSGFARSNADERRRAPVENSSWDDIAGFLRVLADQVPGLEPRLPTEAEWEYACRAGTDTATWAGNLSEDDLSRLRAIAHFDSSEGTALIGERLDSPWGLYDVLGNVWEWCADAWNEDPYAAGSVDPYLPGEPGAGRVARGGSWVGHARFCRAACRNHWLPGDRSAHLGFRLARGPALRG